MKQIFAGVLWALVVTPVGAQPSAEKILPLDATLAEDGRSITLDWFDAEPPRVGSVTVKRRLYGQTGGQSWKTIAPTLGPAMRYTDDTIQPGVAYEYQVLRTARDIVDVGYWLAGTELPAQARRGNAYVILDETMADAIAPRLARFERDLIGDGWEVQRHDVPRNNAAEPVENLNTALEIRKWLRARYDEDPFGQHTVILVGHVPVVLSGKVNPDGHDQRPHPTDLFFADMDGRWSALRSGDLLDNRVPADFIEIQIGRIDFAPVSDGLKDREMHLLRAYFDRNHHWRMGYHGDLREAYGQTGHLAVERSALRNVVGAAKFAEGGHHDLGEARPWLWGVDFGDWNGSRYAEAYANKAVFAINFGSGKQVFDARFNGMTALLSQPWYPVAVGWGARPAWWLHHMALGGSVGDVHMRTVNNGRASEPYRETMDYFPTGSYLMRNAIWINLLGDPTLRAFPLAPPHSVQTEPVATGTNVSWSASPDQDTLGYHVYRSPDETSEFARLTGGDPITALDFVDTDPVDGARYMVRAYGLKTVYAGSFYTLSQGAFSAPARAFETTTAFSVPAGDTTVLPDIFNTVTNGIIRAFIERPPQGQLVHGEGGWLYQPPAGFTGQVPLRFSLSDTWRTQEGLLTLSVSP